MNVILNVQPWLRFLPDTLHHCTFCSIPERRGTEYLQEMTGMMAWQRVDSCKNSFLTNMSDSKGKGKKLYLVALYIKHQRNANI